MRDIGLIAKLLMSLMRETGLIMMIMFATTLIQEELGPCISLQPDTDLLRQGTDLLLQPDTDLLRQGTDLLLQGIDLLAQITDLLLHPGSDPQLRTGPGLLSQPQSDLLPQTGPGTLPNQVQISHFRPVQSYKYCCSCSQFSKPNHS